MCSTPSRKVAFACSASVPSGNGAPVKLADVAEVVDGAENLLPLAVRIVIGHQGEGRDVARMMAALAMLLDDRGDQIFAMTDPLAERVRKIGGTTLRSAGHVTRVQRILDNDADYVEPLLRLRRL